MLSVTGTSFHKSIFKVAIQCVRCLSISQCSRLNLTQQLDVSHRVIKKRIDQTKRYKRLSSKVKLPVVDITTPVTLKELVKLSNTSLDRVTEAFSFIKPDNRFYPNTTVSDFQMICMAMKMLGLRCNHLKKEVESPIVKDLDEYRSEVTADKSRLTPKPPVVTIMGHIDHGKTTLLDTLRKSSIVEGEAGGITQAIGAFSVEVANGRTVTFLDTPGHAAFASMRKRGAKCTDLIILVVAADDSVMEQTIESIRVAKLAGVPVIVAVNKCDSKQAKPARVYEDLADHGIVVENLGGDYQAVEISALKGQGVDELVDYILFQADVLECSADNNAKVEGVVIESRVAQGLGSVASIVIEQGTMRKGQWLVAGTNYAKVKGMMDENGRSLAEGLPGTPVQMIGWKGLPNAGDVALQVKNETRAKQVVQWRTNLKTKEKEMLEYDVISKKREDMARAYKEVRNTVTHKIHRLYALNRAIGKRYEKDEKHPELSVFLKADVDGSLDALLDVFDSYDCSHQCNLNLADFNVGPLNKSDVERAATCQGNVRILCFNQEPSEEVKKLAKQTGVGIISSAVIYHLINQLKNAITSLLPLRAQVDVNGEADVKQLFQFTDGKKDIRQVAGCFVRSGEISFDDTFQLIRDDELLYEGPLFSLRSNQSDVQRVTQGKECGMILDTTESVEIGDVIRCCTISMVDPVLEWNPPGF